MTYSDYTQIRNHMLLMMQDSAHDYLHVDRVLYQALRIAASYLAVNRDVLVASCLLHDIGRQAEYDDPACCHAIEGGKLAYAFMKKLGWAEALCQHIQDCITTHRFRIDRPPRTIEAQILYDADKLDVTGALGIARTLLYQGKMGEPLYVVDTHHAVQIGVSKDTPASFVKEYHRKLSSLDAQFFTDEAKRIAAERRPILEAFYAELLNEIDLSDFDEIAIRNIS